MVQVQCSSCKRFVHNSLLVSHLILCCPDSQRIVSRRHPLSFVLDEVEKQAPSLSAIDDNDHHNEVEHEYLYEIDILSRVLQFVHHFGRRKNGFLKIEIILFYLRHGKIGLAVMDDLLKSFRLPFKSFRICYSSLKEQLLSLIVVKKEIHVSGEVKLKTNKKKGTLSFIGTVFWIHPEFLLRLELATPRDDEFFTEFTESTTCQGFNTGKIWERSVLSAKQIGAIPLCISMYSDQTLVCRFNRGLHALTTTVLNFSNEKSALCGFIPSPIMKFNSKIISKEVLSDSIVRKFKRLFYTESYRSYLNLLPKEPISMFLHGVGYLTFQVQISIVKGDIPELAKLYNLKNACGIVISQNWLHFLMVNPSSLLLRPGFNMRMFLVRKKQQIEPNALAFTQMVLMCSRIVYCHLEKHQELFQLWISFMVCLEFSNEYFSL
jgi:hypothetical protein